MRTSTAGLDRLRKRQPQKTMSLDEARPLAFNFNQTIRTALRETRLVIRACLRVKVRYWKALRDLNDKSYDGINTIEEAESWCSAYCNMKRALFDWVFVLRSAALITQQHSKSLRNTIVAINSLHNDDEVPAVQPDISDLLETIPRKDDVIVEDIDDRIALEDKRAKATILTFKEITNLFVEHDDLPDWNRVCQHFLMELDAIYEIKQREIPNLFESSRSSTYTVNGPLAGNDASPTIRSPVPDRRPPTWV